VCHHFPSIPRRRIRLETSELDICDGYPTEISEEIWEGVIADLKAVDVVESAVEFRRQGSSR